MCYYALYESPESNKINKLNFEESCLECLHQRVVYGYLDFNGANGCTVLAEHFITNKSLAITRVNV